MTAITPAAPAHPAALPPHAVRAVFVRGVAVGAAAGVVCGVALAVALTRPVEGAMRLVRSRVLGGELREPQFELLN